MPKRAILYARVSSSDADRDSLGGQLEMCREHAESRGYAVVEELAEDQRGVSGADPEAPQLRRAVALARERRYEVLVTREMDRLARSLAKQLLVESELQAAGVEIEYCLADYDATPEGQLQKHVRAVVAEYERLKIVERMERGKVRSVERGNVQVAGACPFGRRLEVVDGKRTLTIDEETAAWVRRMYEWYAHGDDERSRLSLADVARKLTAEGVPTSADRGDVPARKRTRRGVWHPSSVRHILASPVHKGEWTYRTPRGETVSVAVEPTVEPSLWLAAQRRLAENKRFKRGNLKHSYLLRGRITCGRCGYRMKVRALRRKVVYLYYCCPATQRSDLHVRCDARMVRSEKLDERVWATLVGVFTDPEATAAAYDEYRSEALDGAASARLARLEEETAKLEARLERLRNLYLAGDVDLAFYQDERDRARTALERVYNDRDEIASAGVDAKRARETLEQFAAQVRDEIGRTTETAQRIPFLDWMDVEVVITADRRAQISACGSVLAFVEVDQLV